jgi:hypothetical protein
MLCPPSNTEEIQDRKVKPVLQIYFSRKLALFATASCAGVFFICILGLNRINDETPMLLQFMLWIMVPLMIWGFGAYLRRLLKPPLMLRADRRGVMIFCDSSHGVIPKEGVFLSWNIVSDMCYEVRSCHGGMRNRVSIPVITCTLSGEAPFPVEKHSAAYLNDDKNRFVCLDAFNGNITKQAMLDQLKPLWQSAKKNQSGDNSA